MAARRPHVAEQPRRDDRYPWIVLTNTTVAMFMSTLDASIVIIALPAIFRGIRLDPLAPGNVAYLLWMIMGYTLVQSVLVVTLGRLGDMYGRVRIYNLGFAVFTVASVLLSLDPLTGAKGAIWLIGWRFLQAFGGSMLTANSAAILTDAFPEQRRGFALGINQVAGLAGQFIGLVAGGVLAIVNWRAVFWINVPVGIFGTYWAYRHLREVGHGHAGRMDWWGNVTFAGGLCAILVAITFGIRPYANAAMGWTNPATLLPLAGGAALMTAFVLIERIVREPMLDLGLLRIRAFAAGMFTALAAAVARGGLQIILVIWLQGVWLPLHGVRYNDAPLWAGIALLPLSLGFLVAGPVSGYYSDRFGARTFATTGLLISAAGFAGLMLMPTDFAYPTFAVLLGAVGIGQGMFSAPNTAAIMSSVPAGRRGVASGMRATFQNAGTLLSIGISFSEMIAGLSGALPQAVFDGLRAHGVALDVARSAAALPPGVSLFSAFLGVNPMLHLLGVGGSLQTLSASARGIIADQSFYPRLIAQPFHDGLVAVLSKAAGLSVIAAIVSLFGTVERKDHS